MLRMRNWRRSHPRSPTPSGSPTHPATLPLCCERQRKRGRPRRTPVARRQSCDSCGHGCHGFLAHALIVNLALCQPGLLEKEQIDCYSSCVCWNALKHWLLLRHEGMLKYDHACSIVKPACTVVGCGAESSSKPVSIGGSSSETSGELAGMAASIRLARRLCQAVTSCFCVIVRLFHNAVPLVVMADVVHERSGWVVMRCEPGVTAFE